jgi:hypothetical protein
MVSVVFIWMVRVVSIWMVSVVSIWMVSVVSMDNGCVSIHGCVYLQYYVSIQ